MKAFFIAVSLISFVILFFVQGELFYSALGLSVSIFLILDFIDKLGKIFPIKEFILLIAAVQWVVGAKISYSFGAIHHKYYMYVDEETYMSYVVPGLILFAIGLKIIRNDLYLDSLNKYFDSDKDQLKRLGIILSLFGLLCGLVNKFFSIPGIAFILYLGNILLYIGLVHLFYVFPNHRFKFYFAVVGIVFVLSLTTGMFHNLLLIASFLSFFLITKETKFITKLLIIVIGGSFIYLLQSIKKDYREIVWQQTVSNPIPIFIDLFMKQFESSNDEVIYIEMTDPNKESADVNNRVNQGWIISKILDNVPSKQPYQNGETIAEGVKASLVPRFLNPDKKGGDYALNKFKEITGIALAHTAMGLSLIGEFYANFGFAGGLISMFIYGLFISLVIKMLRVSVGKENPLMIIWFILFFYQVVKAESNFISIFNHLTKTILFFLVIKFIFSMFNIFILQKQSYQLER